MNGGFRRFGGIAAPTESTQQLAVFTLGSLEYAIDIMRIRQIIRPLPIRPLPRAPAFIDGVIEQRGAVIPVFDLRRRFGLEPAPEQRGRKFIIVKLRGRQLAVSVDSVIGVHRVAEDEIRSTPQWIAGPEAAVFSGVCRREDRLVLILDLEELLSSRDKLNLEALVVPDAGDWLAGQPEGARGAKVRDRDE